VRRGFLQLARQEGKRCVVIDATASVDEVHERIVAALPARGWT
jgi:thymidylate kinase